MPWPFETKPLVSGVQNIFQIILSRRKAHVATSFVQKYDYLWDNPSFQLNDGMSDYVNWLKFKSANTENMKKGSCVTSVRNYNARSWTYKTNESFCLQPKRGYIVTFSFPPKRYISSEMFSNFFVCTVEKWTSWSCTESMTIALWKWAKTIVKRVEKRE